METHVKFLSAYTKEIEDLHLHTQSNKIAYCNNMGYEYSEILFDNPDRSYGMPCVKIAAIIKAMENYDGYILWQDDDIVIMNDTYDITKLIPDENAAIIIPRFLRDPLVHTGCFLIKSCDISRHIFNEIYTGTNYTGFKKHLSNEEAALTHYYQHGMYKEYIRFNDLRLFTSFLPTPLIKGNRYKYTGNCEFKYFKKPRPHMFLEGFAMYKRGDFCIHVPSPATKQEKILFLSYLMKYKEEFI